MREVSRATLAPPEASSCSHGLLCKLGQPKENRHKGGFDFPVLISSVPVLWWAKSAAPGAPVITVPGSHV